MHTPHVYVGTHIRAHTDKTKKKGGGKKMIHKKKMKEIIVVKTLTRYISDSINSQSISRYL